MRHHPHPTRQSGTPRLARSRSTSWSRRAAVILAVSALVLTGCGAAEDDLAAQARAGDNKNYIAGDGSVVEYAQAERSEPLDVEGTLFDGTTISSSDWAGDVVVLNVWSAACAPCRVEAPSLQQLSERFTPDGVCFYGVNVRDERPTAEAFERTFGITYPSFEDRNGKLLLQLTEYVPPQAVPTTLVLDRQGRVAARILGVADEATLRTLINDALDAPASAAAKTTITENFTITATTSAAHVPSATLSASTAPVTKTSAVMLMTPVTEGRGVTAGTLFGRDIGDYQGRDDVS